MSQILVPGEEPGVWDAAISFPPDEGRWPDDARVSPFSAWAPTVAPAADGLAPCVVVAVAPVEVFPAAAPAFEAETPVEAGCVVPPGDVVAVPPPAVPVPVWPAATMRTMGFVTDDSPR